MKKILATLFLLATGLAQATDVIKIVVPYAPGGPADLIAKVVQKDLSQELNRTVVLDYRQGAGGDIGAAAVANADSKETVLLVHSIGLVTNLSSKPSTYNPDRLVPLINLGSQPLVLVVPVTSSLRTIANWRKSPPGKSISFASSGIGSGTHIAGELYKSIIDKELTHIPYKGQGQLIPDLISGQVDSAFMFTVNAVPYVQSNQLYPVAVAATRRLQSMPDVPTFREYKMPEMDIQPWWVLFSNDTKNTAELEEIRTAMVRILSNKKTAQEYRNLGLEQYTTILPPKDFLDTEKSKYASIIKKSGIKLD